VKSRASLIITSNKPFGVGVINRLVHHAEVVALKGDSYG
jgi:DNA replication protein DnaC